MGSLSTVSAPGGLARYRGMIPFLFVLLLLEHAARRWILLVRPIARTGTPPGLYINVALLAIMVVGLVLSLRARADAPFPE
jgi:hypothetical protein